MNSNIKVKGVTILYSLIFLIACNSTVEMAGMNEQEFVNMYEWITDKPIPNHINLEDGKIEMIDGTVTEVITIISTINQLKNDEVYRDFGVELITVEDIFKDSLITDELIINVEVTDGLATVIVTER